MRRGRRKQEEIGEEEKDKKKRKKEKKRKKKMGNRKRKGKKPCEKQEVLRRKWIFKLTSCSCLLPSLLVQTLTFLLSLQDHDWTANRRWRPAAKLLPPALLLPALCRPG